MQNAIIAFISDILPTKSAAVMMSITGAIGAALSFAFGEVDVPIIWLFVFATADYITGLWAAIKTGEWSSSTGFKGIFKKILMFSLVALCHGLDSVVSMDIFRNAAVLAYVINEVCSILENIERVGYGGVIPAPLRRGLKVLKKKEDKIFEEAGNDDK